MLTLRLHSARWWRAKQTTFCLESLLFLSRVSDCGAQSPRTFSELIQGQASYDFLLWGHSLRSHRLSLSNAILEWVSAWARPFRLLFDIVGGELLVPAKLFFVTISSADAISL